MAIFRGTGGQGDSTTDTTITVVTQKAADAASSASQAAASASSATTQAGLATDAKNDAETAQGLAEDAQAAAEVAQGLAENAQTAAEAAQTAAETAETNAETAETNAETAQTAAEAAQAAAETAETNAETAETNAETAYTNTLAIFGDAQDVQDAVDSATASATTATTQAGIATTKAGEAASSATDAETAQTAAETAQTAAETAQGLAETAQTAAETAQTAAELAETNAETAQGLAETAQTAAETAQTAAELAETNAETAEANAATSESNAATSEANASNSASTATTQAGIATTQAGIATTKASEAASSATDAQNAQTAAETAQAAAEAAQEAIDGLYLGTNTSNPTVDLNGDPVTAGDWYFNTTDNTTRIYDGSNWNTVNPDLIGDTTPQLGGDLDLNSNDITGTGDIDITGDISLTGTVDGRDIAADGTKLDGIEDNADVTDTANVTAAGALMDSEVTNLDQVKAFNSADYATAAQGSTADSALQNVSGDTTPQLGGDLDLNSNDITGTGNIDITGGIAATDNSTFTVPSGDIYVTAKSTSGSNRAGFRVDETASDNFGFEMAHDNADNAFFISRRSGSTTPVDVIKIDRSTGDIAFYDNSGSSQDFYWDASTSRLGLGTTSPSSTLDVTGSVTVDGTIKGIDGQNLQVQAGNGAGDKLDLRAGDDVRISVNGKTAHKFAAVFEATGDISFYNASESQDFYWDASTSRLGLGTTAPEGLLHIQSSASGALINSAADDLIVDNSGSGGITVASGAGAYGNVFFADSGSSIAGYIQYLHLTDYMRFGTNGTEAMRLDSSGNLLVGRTSFGFGGSGHAIRPTLSAVFNNDGGAAVIANRNTSDGDILDFRKDGSTVGSIGVDSSDNIFLSGNSSHSGLMVATNAIIPYANGAITDTADLGMSAFPWRNLYLSGGVYLGGTTSDNLLDSYEEGTWTPVTDNVSGFSSATITGIDARYTKIGRQVTLEFEFSLDSSTGNIVAGDDVVLTSSCLPFTPSFNGHAVGTFGSQSGIGTGENVAMGYAGLSGFNRLGILFHTVDGTVARSNNMGGVVTYFTDA